MALNPEDALDSSKGKKEKEVKNCRWSEKETRSLIKEWKDNVTELESSRNRQAWLKIINNVNKNGPKKTVEQAKKKLSNLKDGYKKAKENNRKSGAAPDFPPFFEDFDEVLSCRPIVELDLVREVGVAVEEDNSCEDRSVVEKGFLEMQERQMEALRESDQRNREFLMQLEEQQRKAAIGEKERDRIFYAVGNSFG
eukprot:gene3532-2016_t